VTQADAAGATPDPPPLSRAQLAAMGAGIVLLCGWILVLGLLARAKQR
jgi:hypothetical protein